MVDIFSKEKRSQNMAAIKSKNTKPELAIRKLLFNKGFRFRLHSDILPGSPDVVLKKYKVVVFIHGCFWHHHPCCNKSHYPKSNVAFWKNKIEKNQQRDQVSYKEINLQGWHVIVIWECFITKKNLYELGKQLEQLIKNPDYDLIYLWEKTC